MTKEERRAYMKMYLDRHPEQREKQRARTREYMRKKREADPEGFRESENARRRRMYRNNDAYREYHTKYSNWYYHNVIKPRSVGWTPTAKWPGMGYRNAEKEPVSDEQPV